MVYGGIGWYRIIYHVTRKRGMTSGLGELEKEDPAVYYQKSKSVQDEYLLIELCTEVLPI